MSMVTQCPHCSTAFNVTPEQLFARDGRVRCGQCRQVFDGLVNLTSLEALEAGVPPPLAEASDAELRAKVVAMEAERVTPSHGFAPLNWPMVPEVPVVPMPVAADEAAYELTPAAAPVTAAGASAGAAPTPSEDLDDGSPGDTPPRRLWPWALAASVAALALCAQMLYAYRNDIAAHVPGVRPALTQFCAWAQCTIQPLQKPSALAIQASDLLILDKAKPHLVQLIVTMQNQSSVDVGYPAIDLVLNDRFDHAVARRVFLPADYVRNFDPRTSIIGASVATTVRIDLDLSELSAGGFALLLIPAPQT